ncbi:hypothetical protein APICC_02257 [Apis cerana cerana]|uniref:Uncharacterized protein n=1 Tax=Apis cerana cerana TaxID=94128 RepID=A0A2A3EKQ7_APICC|nr:hypothetical protein APICC_02257 [Apis cerana cerana]
MQTQADSRRGNIVQSRVTFQRSRDNPRRQPSRAVRDSQDKSNRKIRQRQSNHNSRVQEQIYICPEKVFSNDQREINTAPSPAETRSTRNKGYPSNVANAIKREPYPHPCGIPQSLEPLRAADGKCCGEDAY